MTRHDCCKFESHVQDSIGRFFGEEDRTERNEVDWVALLVRWQQRIEVQ